GSERCGLFQFRDGQIVFMPLGIHHTEVGVGVLIERIVLELLVEGLYRIVVLTLVPVHPAQVVVGVIVVGINFDLFLESGDGSVVIARIEISQAEIVPGVLVLRINLGGALDQNNRDIQIPVLHGGTRAVDKVVGLHVGGRNGRACDRVLDGKMLLEVGADRAAERFVVRRPRRRQFTLAKGERTAGGEDAAIDLVGGFVLGIIALQRDRQRRMRYIFAG